MIHPQKTRPQKYAASVNMANYCIFCSIYLASDFHCESSINTFIGCTYLFNFNYIA